MTSLPETLFLIQCALSTWIIWETAQVWVGRWIKPEFQLLPVALIAAGVALIPWQFPREVASTAAIVALLHYFLSSAGRAAKRR